MYARPRASRPMQAAVPHRLVGEQQLAVPVGLQEGLGSQLPWGQGLGHGVVQGQVGKGGGLAGQLLQRQLQGQGEG